MVNWFSGEKIMFLLGFPVIMTTMLYLSALLGIKWQGAWVDSPLFRLLHRAPRPLRLTISAMAGAVTPFCSCTTIPGFTAILEAQLGLDTAMAFLIASPTIDPAGTFLLAALVGPKLTLIYVMGCFITSVLGGWILGKIFTHREINPVVMFGCASAAEPLSWQAARGQAWQYISRFWWVILFSTLLGFVLYDYVPDSLIAELSARTGYLSIPAAAIVGTLIYAHTAVLIPVGAALLAKGMAPGIILAFLASAAGISPPEIVLLRKIVSFRLTLAYIICTITLITAMGFTANWLGW